VSDWGDFAVVMGAATAALLGLLFVAVVDAWLILVRLGD
jgi:hypothetical protein